MKIQKEETIFVFIDFQERLLPVMQQRDELVEAVRKLAYGADVLGIPKLVTQQYTKGLGETVPEIAEALGEFSPIEKTSFSTMGEAGFSEQMDKSGKRTVVVSGIETHVCVMQTVLDLMAQDYRVVVVADAVSSRKERDRHFALRRMELAGAIVTTTEAVLFELCGGSREPEFKQISNLVK
ncbi:MAG TPA: isochorismatase family protein [Clostridiales bacterium]|jgi:nicotinamidase-related amidase|nr:isochorismatase family protein [Clostridiales bacterium]